MTASAQNMAIFMILKIKRLKTALSDGNALPFRAWRFFLQCSRAFAAHHLSAYAAQMTFYLMLAAFPFVMLICIFTRFLPLTAEALQESLTLLLPEHLGTLAVSVTEGYYNENIGGIRIWLLLFLIWSCARLFLALMNALNSIGSVRETRGQLRLRLIGCGYTVVFCVLLTAAVGMLGFGGALLERMGQHHTIGQTAGLLLAVVRDLVSPLLLLLIFWCSYVFLPGERPKFRQTFFGALMTALFWRGAAALYTLFLQRSVEKYSYVYGSLAGLVMLLLWLYACMYCWLLGAELNRLLMKKKTAKIRENQ